MPTSLHLLFWGFVATYSVFITTDRQLREVLKNHWKPVCFVVVLALLWRIPLDGHFFYGLEYEDAYVYAVSGRQIALATNFFNPANSKYLITVCAVGNLNSCKLSETFSGHFIGYPFMIAIASRVFGYSPAIGSYLSLCASLAAVIFIFVACKLIDPGGITAAAGSAVFCLTPVFAVHGVGTSAEPVSNFLVMVCLLLCIRLLNPNPSDSSVGLLITWSALTFASLFAAVVKRENLILLPIMIFAGVVSEIGKSSDEARQKRPRYLMVVVSICLCVGFALNEMQLTRTIQSETAEYSVFPFNLLVFRTMFPLFMKSFLSLPWYLGSGIIVLAGLVASTRLKRLSLYPCGLLVAFLMLYASHVRSHYQLQGGDVTAFDTIRYSMNFAGLYSVIAGIGFSYAFAFFANNQVVNIGKKFLRPIWGVLLVFCVASSWMLTNRLREDMATDELAARIQPAQSAIKFVAELGTPNTFVITAEPLVIQMLARDSVNVIDFKYINSKLVHDLLDENPSLNFLYLEQASYLSAANKIRYADSHRFLDAAQKRQLHRSEYYTVYLLNFASSR